MTTFAPQSPVALKNVASFMTMTMRLIERAPHLPGFGVCHGPSGFGKSCCAQFAQMKVRARMIEAGETWNRQTLLREILRECGETFRKSWSTSDLAEKAKAALGADPSRPLIVDEADKLVDKNMIDILRELQKRAGMAVILVGEEQLPNKLLQVERMHNNVLHWFPAQPCDLDDTRVLAKAFVPKVDIRDDLLDVIRQRSGGRARRIVINLDAAAEFARNHGHKTLDLRLWGGEAFYTGKPPAHRNIQQFPTQQPLKVV
ncbi:ATP-binding protein [Bradyrhizobium sp. BR 10289]|uniref:AAA family ATPase n=1 Tax=Bradyrhizobium sp. BR 10289 TaxID=2749993 RepID=UPI001C649F78|nr:ATP-binding protein [Bradyrhizobium sp. BR 10289]MBW7968146.1 ATP-binding protein [Bradyrhizobium sp. BR 10289]